MLPRVTSLRGLATCLRPRGASQGVPNRRKLSTLDPARLTAADFVYLGGEKIHRRSNPRLCVPFVHSKPGEYLPFPPHTQGFFYFSPGPHHAPAAGEVRFRITSGPDPAGFAGGRDLCLPGQPTPWGIPLLNILKSKTCHKLLQELLMDRDEAVNADLAAAVREHKSLYLTQNTHLIHSFGQPFVHDLSWKTLTFRVALGPRVCNVVHLSLPVEGRDTHNNYRQPVYTGKVVCCLEALNHQGRQAVSLRILEVIEPARPMHEDYDGWTPAPVAGELLKTGGGDVWAHKLHESQASSSILRALLWNTPAASADGYIMRGHSRSILEREAGWRMLRCVRNLAPDKLAASDWMDFSLQTDTLINVYDEPSATRGKTQDVLYSPRHTPFPQGTTGFIYLHMPNPDHPIGAQLRFRVVPEPDPAAFAAGHDLRAEDGTIWSRWLPPMLTQQGVGNALVQIVIREGLIDRAVVDQWRSGGDTAQRPIAKKSISAPLACPGSEPFLLNLAVAAPTITLGVGSCARKTRIQLVLPFAILEQLNQGRALVQLEQDDERQTCSLRIVKVFGLQLHPDQSSAPGALEEGALLKISSGPRLWRMVQEMRESQ